MRFVKALIALALAAEAAVGSSWFRGSKAAAYNAWHETELERWLSDHDIPYPSPADRKDLEDLISKNWNDHFVSPYNSWDTAELKAYLQKKGVQAQESANDAKDVLLAKVRNVWYETEEKTQTAWTSSKDWILDTWTESTLRAFCVHHGIPAPQPRQRDTLLQKARESYTTVANKISDAASYPGNWLYETWSEGDLNAWLDIYGFSAPQPSTRDKLVAAVRRNSRLAYLKMQEQAASAQAAHAALTDKIIDAWSESDLNQFCDKNGIKVPQGTKLNQLRALVRKHRAKLLGDTISATAESAYDAATSQVAQATDSASKLAQDAFYEAIEAWSESRLKAYLDARGIPVPHGSTKNEIRALVRKNAHQAATRWDAFSNSFDDWSVEKLYKYLEATGDAAVKKVSEKSSVSRDELVRAAHSAYASASSVGGETYATATSYIVQATDSAKESLLDTWSESELKSYLDSYGIPVPQDTALNELRAYARKQYTFFKFGTTTPTETLFAKVGENVKEGWAWVKAQVNEGVEAAKRKLEQAKKGKNEL